MWPRNAAGLRTSRGNRKDHPSSKKFNSFVRGGAGGFSRPSIACRDSSLPFSSTLSRQTVNYQLSDPLDRSKFPKLARVTDVSEKASLLQGQALKSFMNNVRPEALGRIEQFVSLELQQLSHIDGGPLNGLPRIQALSTAWQALNECLPQARGTLEDLREICDTKIDELRLALLLLKKKKLGLPRKFNILEGHIHQCSSSAAMQEYNHKSSNVLRTSESVDNGNLIADEQRGRTMSSSSSSSSASGSSKVSTENNCITTTLHEGQPPRDLAAVQIFWHAVSQNHRYKSKESQGTGFLDHICTSLLPCLMSSVHQLSRHIFGISKVKGEIFLSIWLRAMRLITEICRHAKRMRSHHIRVLESLEESLIRHREALHLNEVRINIFQHEKRPAEVLQQERLSILLSEKSTELQLLQERKSALMRMERALCKLFDAYKKRRHSMWQEEEQSALEDHLSTVTLGTLSTAMEKQKDRLRKAEISSASSELYAKVRQVIELLARIKSNIKQSIGASVSRNVAVQVSFTDRSWTVHESSARKLAPSRGWWTLHNNTSNTEKSGKLAKHNKSRGSNTAFEAVSAKFDLGGSDISGERVDIPTKFKRTLTIKVSSSQVRSMARITYLKLVHSIYLGMIELWLSDSRIQTHGGESSDANKNQHETNSQAESLSRIKAYSTLQNGETYSSGSSLSVVNSMGWLTSSSVSDFVYDYLLLQFGIAELSEPKLLQLLATSYRMRNKLLRAKIFCWFCGILKPRDASGRIITNLYDHYEEDALRFFLGAYSYVRSVHPMGRCIEVPKKSLIYAEIAIASSAVYELFKGETEETQQSIMDTMQQHSKMLSVQKSMLGADSWTAGRSKGNNVRVIDVDLLLDLWLTKWTVSVARKRKRFQILFVASDVNEDGRLSYREFSTMLRALEPSIESHQIAELFRGCLHQTARGGAEIDCSSFTDYMARATYFMAPAKWEGCKKDGGRENNPDDCSEVVNDFNGNFGSVGNASTEPKNSCMQMYGSSASHRYLDVSRSVRLLREEWARWHNLVEKHQDWISSHAKTPDEKWDAEHCKKRLVHFQRLFEHALEGPDSAELAWQAYRLLRHQTETLRQNRTILSHAMAPIHLVSRFKSKMTHIAQAMAKQGASEPSEGNKIPTNALLSGSGEKQSGQAFSYARWNHVDELLRLIDLGSVCIDLLNDQGNSLLHVACQNGHLNLVRLLCRKGIAVNMQNKRGNTALHFSRYYDYDQIFRFLRQAGADDSLRNDDGETCYEMSSSGT